MSKMPLKIILIYSLIRFLDVESTYLNIKFFGPMVELNPFMRYLMDNYGTGWIGANYLISFLMLIVVSLCWSKKLVRYAFMSFLVINLLVVISNYYAYISTLRIVNEIHY